MTRPNASASPLAESLQALREGRFVLLYDADGREEETDLVIASQFVTPDAIRHLRTAGGGLICTTLPPAFHQALGLPYLADVFSEARTQHPILARLADAPVPYEGGGSKPSFTVSINHRRTFTGITDNDRALTITSLATLAAQGGQVSDRQLQDDFVRQFKAPGHVFLLNAKDGLLRSRRGHTELSTALMELAGLVPSATICEMMNGPSGRALPKDQAIAYAGTHGIPFLGGAPVVDAWEHAQPLLATS